MLRRNFDAIGEADLDGLVAAGVAEDRTLEFKAELPGGGDADIKEFLADVTSLANTAGGDLLFGVQERAGVAAALGLVVTDSDAALLRLENIIRDGIQPRLSGVRARAIHLSSGQSVLAIRVPASLNAPHRIRYKNSGRFFARNSRGKFEMDVDELRDAFLGNDALGQRFNNLHGEAVYRSDGRDMPFAVGPGPVAILTLAPLGLFRDRRDITFRPGQAVLPPRLSGAYDQFPSLEGLVMRSPIGEARVVRCYSLNHRTGWIEAAWVVGRQLELDEYRGVATPPLQVWPKYLEEGVETVLSQAVGVLEAHDLQGPWITQLTLRGLAKAIMVVGDGYQVGPAWRATATLPSFVFEGPSKPDLTPLFRNFWLLFGEERPANGAT